METPQYYHRKFEEALKRESGTDSFQEAKEQWRVVNVAHKEEDTECICTHPIRNLCFLQNITDGRQLIVGSTCVYRCFPKKQADIAKEKFRELDNKRRKCDFCKTRYDKKTHDQLCNTCRMCCVPCEDCGNWRKWNMKCKECHVEVTKVTKVTETIKPVKRCEKCGCQIDKECFRCKYNIRNL